MNGLTGFGNEASATRVESAINSSTSRSASGRSRR